MTTTKAETKEPGRGIVAGNFIETLEHDGKNDANDFGKSEAPARDRLIHN